LVTAAVKNIKTAHHQTEVENIQKSIINRNKQVHGNTRYKLFSANLIKHSCETLKEPRQLVVQTPKK
jgi:hypothetical protein